MPMTAAISAVRRQVREMVDGTLEIKLHVSPVDKAAFHQLFPDIDMPVALAPLNPQFAQTANSPEPEKEKPGPLCMLAVNWCRDADFQDWLFEKLAISGWQMSPVTSEETTKNNLCLLLGIQSRREIDTNPEAAMRFQTLIRLPYMKYQTTGVIE